MTPTLPAAALAAAPLARAPAGVIRAAVPDIERLEAELRELKGRLEETDRLEQRIEELEAEIERLRRPAPVAREDAAARRAAAETVTEPEPDQAIEVDGVLRFNFFVEDLDEAVKDKRCDNGLDLFRLSADGRYKDVLISADYRWYPFMQTLHHGWVGYELAHGGPWNLQLAFYLLQEPRDR